MSANIRPYPGCIDGSWAEERADYRTLTRWCRHDERGRQIVFVPRGTFREWDWERRRAWISRHMPRWFNWLFALAANYWWLPCPRCGRGFAAYEAGDIEPIPGREREIGMPHRSVCNRCSPRPASPDRAEPGATPKVRA